MLDLGAHIFSGRGTEVSGHAESARRDCVSLTLLNAVRISFPKDVDLHLNKRKQIW
jgi:hypothetical protein